MRNSLQWQGYWEGRESTQWEGTIKNLQEKIPTFTQEVFRIGEGVNKYKDVIVREPLSEVPEDIGYVETLTREFIPVAAVSNNYRGHLFRGRKQGYKLVNHHELLGEVLAVLAAFDSDINIDYIESLQTTLLLSIYGARMHIEFLVPHYKRDSYTLKVTCRNSVDGKFALIINLFLHRSGDATDIPFDSFRHVHTQELKDNAVTNFMYTALNRFVFTAWDTDEINRDMAVQFIDNSSLTPEQRRRLIIIIGKGKQKRVLLLRIREILALLFDEGKEVFQNQSFAKFAKLTMELNKLVDETEAQQANNDMPLFR